jgi:hypothetical protein
MVNLSIILLNLFSTLEDGMPLIANDDIFPSAFASLSA